MLDIRMVREKPKEILENLKRRQNPDYLKMFDNLLKVDETWRKLTTEMNQLRSKRNEISEKIAAAKKEKKDAKKLMEEAAKIPEKLKKNETELAEVEEKEKGLLMRIPNLLHESVPFGKDDTENVEIRRVGKPPKFDFEPKDHLTILKNLGLVDDERAAKTAGHGFFYLKGDAVLLDLAIQRFALDFLQKKGFTVIEPPYMLKKEGYLGVTDLEFFGEQLYKIEGEDEYMIATSEHPMVAAFMDETIDQNNLPIKWTGVSPCFRKEVGAHGKYTKGFFRMHQFNKIEQVVICRPEDSWKFFEEIQKNTEGMFQELGIHYRVVNVCTGDIGIIAAKKYDTEIWMADGSFREVGSCSNCTDYQARRLNIKWREGPGKSTAGFAHTLNNTGLATSRAMIAIIEQFQNADGTVTIPKTLRPFMGGKEKLEKLKN